MMSIFSSFDAVCSDYFGVPMGSSLLHLKEDDAKVGSAQTKVLKTVEEEMKKKSSSKPAVYVRSLEKKQQWVPRFAPELDGLHCFETLISSSKSVVSVGSSEKKQQWVPTFAPELDGLHCFETLISSSKPIVSVGGSEKKQPWLPRFAPQLDGLHCFETLISH